MPDTGQRTRLPGRRQPRGLFERVATGVVAAIAFVFAGVAAVFFFTFFFALVAALSAVVMTRVWWLRRKFRKAFSQAAKAESVAAGGDVLEGEFVVVEKEDETTGR